MPRDLFGDVVHASMTIGSRKWYTLPLSIVIHALIITVAVIVPLVATDVFPALPVMLSFPALAPPGVPPSPPPVQRVAARAVPRANPDAAPVSAPSGVKPDSGIVRDPEPADTSGVEGGVPGGVPGSVTAGLNEPPPPPPAPSAPIRINQGIRQPTKIRDVHPTYPIHAQLARVQGTVILEAVIGADGRVADARVLRSIPLLDRAALDAVMQWLYTPTLLSGVPVPVVMTVTVTFTLR